MRILLEAEQSEVVLDLLGKQYSGGRATGVGHKRVVAVFDELDLREPCRRDNVSVQGIHPATWWEKDRAGKATRIAIALWVALLAGLVSMILLLQKG